jgi:hypothetical protein
MPGFGSAPPKVALLQATVPERVLSTHLSLTPNDTWRGVSPTLQLLPSSAHLENPDGQSTAKAGVAAAQAIAIAVDRNGVVLVFMGMSLSSMCGFDAGLHKSTPPADNRPKTTRD